MKHRHKHIKHSIKRFKPKKSIFKRPLFWILFLLVIICATTIYFLFFFPKFQVDSITVSGNQKVDGKDIETAAWQGVQKNLMGVSYKTIFMVNTAAITQSLLADFPQIENIQVQKKGFQDINIKVTERSLAAIFCVDPSLSNCFYLDNNGVIYQKADIVDTNDIIIRSDVSEFNPKLGSAMVDKDTISGVIKIHDDLKNNFQIDITQVLAANPLVVTTSEGWRVYFDPNQGLPLQVLKLDALLKEQIPEADRKALQYIYLQYKDRAYYK